jgi:RNA polymerase sigma-70 factor (ECF subfamily)
MTCEGNELTCSTDGVDKQDFEQIIRQYQGYVSKIVASLIADPHEAEDLCIEVFLRVYKALPKYKPRGKFKAWLARIATNVCLNDLRRQKRSNSHISLDAPLKTDSESNERLIDRIAGHTPDAQKLLETRERDHLVRQAIHRLPETQRIITILWMEEEFSYKEIARIVGCTTKAVERRLSRARTTLRKELAHLFSP